MYALTLLLLPLPLFCELPIVIAPEAYLPTAQPELRLTSIPVFCPMCAQDPPILILFQQILRPYVLLSFYCHLQLLFALDGLSPADPVVNLDTVVQPLLVRRWWRTLLMELLAYPKYSSLSSSIYCSLMLSMMHWTSMLVTASCRSHSFEVSLFLLGS